MTTYIIKRIFAALLVILIVSVFVFSIVHIMPGDPVQLALGPEASDEDVQRIRENKGLNDPLPEQYFNWMTDIIIRGDLGESLVRTRTVASMFKERLPRTIAIGLPAFAISVVLGILFGIISAIKRGTVLDQGITLFTTVGIGTPQFWIGIFLIYIFSVKLDWTPMRGLTLPSDNFLEYLRSAILPIFCMSLPMTVMTARQTRANMIEVINQDYIRTARANGLPNRKVIYGHAIKNAMIPVVTIIGMRVRSIIGGAVLIESVFSIVGIGGLMREAINNRDYFVLQSLVLVLSAFTVLSNLGVDIIYGILDPRIREARRGM